MRCGLTVLCLLGLATALVRAEGAAVRVLTVGNSFANDALRHFGAIAEASGDRVIVGRANLGGCDLARHVRHLDAHEADPDAPEGRPYANGTLSLRDLLTREPWDFVTIQQVSHQSFRPESYQPHADRLIAAIREHAPQAEIVIHQTWAYREDHPFWGRDDFDTDRMYAGLRAAYDALARETGLRQISSGDAMQAARLDADWGPFVPDPAFDPETARHPDLPEEARALHQGFSWRRNEDGTYRLGSDRFHANAAGTYLLGCVWYEFFFGKSVLGNAFRPGPVSPEDAVVLQRIAHRVVSEGFRP